MQSRLGARRLRVLGTVTALVVGAVVGTAATAHASTPAKGIRLSGVVRAADGGAPVAGVTIDVVSDDGDAGAEGGFSFGATSAVASAVTNSAGKYTVSGGLLPYTPYQVCFLTGNATGPATGYVQHCYGDDTSDKHTQPGQPVVFEPRQHRTGFDASLDLGAELSGTVTDADGQPLKHVAVGFGPSFFTSAGTVLPNGAVYASSGDDGILYFDCTSGCGGPLGAVQTNASGHFTIKGIAPGPWTTVGFDPAIATGGDSSTGYLDEVYDHQQDRATPIALIAGQHVTISTKLADAPAPPSGSISGTVRNAKGKGIEGADVAATYSTGLPPSNVPGIADATTNSAGHYTISGLANGGYSVCVTPTSKSVHAGGAAAGCRTPSNVKVANGDARTGINIVSAVGAQISGHVTDGHGHGLGKVQVVVQDDIDSASQLAGIESGEGTLFQTATTKAGGGYTISGLPAGTYSVCFDASNAVGPSALGYADQCFNQEPADGTPDPVTLAVGQSKTINPALTGLATLPSVSGRVNDLHGGLLGDVSIELRSAQNSLNGNDYDNTDIITAQSGHFSVQGVPAGKYYVCAYGTGTQGGSSKGGYVDACGKSGRLTITVGTKSVNGVDFKLAAAGSVSGIVTDGAGNPVSGANVEVLTSAKNQDFDIAETRADGSYDIDGLANGTYRVCVDASQASQNEGPLTGLAPTCDGNIAWNQKTAPSPDLTVTAGSNTPVSAIKLGAGAAIAGHVTDSHGDPVGGVEVDISPVKSTDYLAFNETTTAPDGSYLMPGLAPGAKYSVCFSTDSGASGPSPTGYVSTCNGGAPYDQDGDGTPGTPVKALAGTTTVNIALPDAGEISGKVLDADGSPVSGAQLELITVSAFGESAGGPSVETYDDGTYGLAGLAAGSYSLCFDGGSSKHNVALGLLGQCYKNKSVATSNPTLVKVALGQQVSNVNGTEGFAGGVSGHVSDEHGAPAAGIVVIVDVGGLENVGSSPIEEGVTDALGNYTVDGVAPGKKVSACFINPNSGSESHSSCYKNKSAGTTTPTTFTVVAGKLTKEINGTVKL